jgi:hypothetical protein
MPFVSFVTFCSKRIQYLQCGLAGSGDAAEVGGEEGSGQVAGGWLVTGHEIQ